MQDAAGRLVPIANIKPEHLLEDEMVRRLHDQAEMVRYALATFKANAFAEVRALLDILAQQYGSTRGGAKGNVQFRSFDGTLSVQLAVGEHISFGPELQIAKQHVDECLRRWTEGANHNLRAIVNDAFEVDKEGKVNADRILSLRRLEIQDETWKLAMDAISGAVRTTRSKEYIRLYVREAPEKDPALVPLDIARV
ncbi:DUF3164 family protein [Roseomonas sp. HJA6]|uniref:DUF3164 family protein n=1 Tax=Roseomonas alba TaxID=2846776 RepID=A0ABS7ACS8_9PROT|nr:DUF3164 family protein [Neoroseomonas alba]MBW6399968.1 DUF3164 family protein [Neoroseomonas alba]